MRLGFSSTVLINGEYVHSYTGEWEYEQHGSFKGNGVRLQTDNAIIFVPMSNIKYIIMETYDE